MILLLAAFEFWRNKIWVICTNEAILVDIMGVNDIYEFFVGDKTIGVVSKEANIISIDCTMHYFFYKNFL